MGTPNVVLMPDNLDQELGDLRRKIRALETAAPVTLLSYSESVDAAHPMSVDFVIANGVQISIAKLSFKLRLFRTTSSFAGGTTGGQSANHTHDEGSHSHSHAHTLPIDFLGVPSANQTVGALANGHLFNNSGANFNTSAINTDATSTSPGSTGNANVDHTHSVGASSLGVGEGTATTISALLVDGVDKTSLLGGPWLTDKVDLDISTVLPLGDGLWHTIQLTPAGQGRIVAVLKIAA